LHLSQRIYVGNLPFSATTEEVEELFSGFGEVISVALPTDRETGRPRGFGFVEMEDNAANEAIRALDGTDFGGRNLRVNPAQPRESRGGGGGRWVRAAAVVATAAMVATGWRRLTARRLRRWWWWLRRRRWWSRW
jgi:RNA recognition motif-containing protein